MLSTQLIQTSVNRLVNEGADALIKLTEAASIVGSRVMDKHDDLASASKRVRMQMQRSMKVCGDVMVGGLWCRDDGLFTCDEVARWAKLRYPGLFDDLPTKSRTFSESVKETVRAAVHVETEWEPIDPEVLRAMVRSLCIEIKQHDAAEKQIERERKEELVSRFGKRKKKHS